jgi:cobalt/nickel transport system ATP-binding protein
LGFLIDFWFVVYGDRLGNGQGDAVSDNVFEVRDVHYAYLGRFPALAGVEMSIQRGKKIALMGANGSGKSTLLHLLDALAFADKGNVSFMGHELKESDFEDDAFSCDFRRRVGLVFQNPDVQLFCPTVREDIVFGPLQLGLGEAETKKRLEKAVETLRISHLLDRSPHQLSIGEKRKVAFASTLVIDPEVLLLDEPTAGLDPQTTANILELLLKASLEGKTVITATHDTHVVEDISDEIYVFGQDKRIAGHGKPADILANQELLKANNLIHSHPHTHHGEVHSHPHQHLEHHS